MNSIAAGMLLLGVTADDPARFAFSFGHARAYWQLSECHCQWLRENHWQFAGREHLYARWMADAERCRQAWYWLDDGWYPHMPIDARIGSMVKLRMLIGEDAWVRGEMPPPVPWWHFNGD